MAKKLDKKTLSQFDGQQVLKSTHQEENQALRVTSANSHVPPAYSSVTLTYNANGSVTNAMFFDGESAQVTDITCVADVAGSLNNKYWILYPEGDSALYHIWYNVSSGGTDPAPVGSAGIEIKINTGDSASIIALATRLVLNLYEDFSVESTGGKVRVTNARKGSCTAASDGDTTFDLTTINSGTTSLIKSIDIPYANNIRYIFNELEQQFEIGSTVAGEFTLSGLRTALLITNTTVTDTAAKLPLTPLSSRNSIIIENRSAVDSMFIGNSDVTASGAKEGWELGPGAVFSIDITDAIEYWAIAAAGKTPTVKVKEVA